MSVIFWEDVPEIIDEWTEKTAAPAADIRTATANMYTNGDFGFYWNPEVNGAGMFARLFPTQQDVALCKMALDRAVGRENVLRDGLLTWNEVANGGWVKVAYSKPIRRAGELLNFFPGEYPGGIPNAPSPLASTLTGGLVGAGLGYGAGWLGEKLLPKKWRRNRLRRTLAMLGGAAGATPGAMWLYSAMRRGRSPMDGSDLAQSPDSEPIYDAPPLVEAAKTAGDEPLGEMYKGAVDSFVKRAFGSPMASVPFTRYPKGPVDVNINKMGHTLWEVGASPQTTATTMGALYAAQQMPDPNSRPGHVTPNQTGLLAQAMGAAKGYAGGWLVGKTLGATTGASAGFQNTLAKGGAILGIVNTTIPQLFR